MGDYITVVVRRQEERFKKFSAVGPHGLRPGIGDPADRGGQLGRQGAVSPAAQDILEESNAVLGREGGGEIAQNLRGLYLLMNRRLLPANVPKDPQMIREVIARMEDLNQSYETITG
jgi:hypothetical protein